MSSDVPEHLLRAQDIAERLFAAIEAEGILRPGVSESEASDEILELAATRFGAPNWWHRRIVRAGRNTMCPYSEHPRDLRIGEDDIAFVDLGPVFDGWEADFGKTFVIGDDPLKRRIRDRVYEGFERGREFFASQQECSGAELYSFMVKTARELGYEFGGAHAGHLVGAFPHAKIDGHKLNSYIHPRNPAPMRGQFDDGAPRMWILESHLVDRPRGYGAFYEALLNA